MKFDAVYAHWQALPPARQRLLAVGWLLVVLMALYVAGRPLLNAWQDALRWQALTSQASTLPPTRKMIADDWGGLASASALVLTEARSEGAGWQLGGRLERPDALAGFVERAAARGWRADGWLVSKDGEGLRFDLQLQPRGGEPQP